MAAYPAPPGPPQAHPQPPAAQPPLHEAGGPVAAKLHDLALGAEKNLEALATGLAQVNADPGAVKAVSGMANTMRQLLTVMAHQAQSEPPRPTIDSATRDLAAQTAHAPAPTH